MPKIDDYDFGRIVVDGVEQTRDVILLPGRVVPNWWRHDGHTLVPCARTRVRDPAVPVGCQNSVRAMRNQRLAGRRSFWYPTRLGGRGRRLGPWERLRLLIDPQPLADPCDEAGHGTSLRRFAGVQDGAYADPALSDQNGAAAGEASVCAEDPITPPRDRTGSVRSRGRLPIAHPARA